MDVDAMMSECDQMSCYDLDVVLISSLYSLSPDKHSLVVFAHMYHSTPTQ
jgi:hypothetical protein